MVYAPIPIDALFRMLVPKVSGRRAGMRGTRGSRVPPKPGGGRNRLEKKSSPRSLEKSVGSHSADGAARHGALCVHETCNVRDGNVPRELDGKLGFHNACSAKEDGDGYFDAVVHRAEIVDEHAFDLSFGLCDAVAQKPAFTLGTL